MPSPLLAEIDAVLSEGRVVGSEGDVKAGGAYHCSENRQNAILAQCSSQGNRDTLEGANNRESGDYLRTSASKALPSAV